MDKPWRDIRVFSELGQSLLDFGKAIKLLGACEDSSLGKAFSELGSRSELLSLKLNKEVFAMINLVKYSLSQAICNMI